MTVKQVGQMEFSSELIEQWVRERAARITAEYSAGRPDASYEARVSWSWDPEDNTPHATVKVMRMPPGPSPEAVLAAHLGEVIAAGVEPRPPQQQH